MKTTKVGEALNPEINTRNPEQIPEINTRNPEITKRGKSEHTDEKLSHGSYPFNFSNTRMARRPLTHEQPEDHGVLPHICDGETSHKRGLVSLADKETSLNR